MSLCYYFLSVICSIYSINSSKIIFKWSLPLTSMKFFTSSSFFNASVAVIFLFSSSSVTISSSKFLQFTNHHIRVEKTGKLKWKNVKVKVKKYVKFNMHVFLFFPTNHRVSASKRKFLLKMLTRCSKKCPL